MFTVEGSHVQLRPIAESDADLVVKWRNSKEARCAFFTKGVVTPDTHIAFVRNRKPHDLVWIVETAPIITDAIGTASLTVDTANYKAEFGRLFVDESYRNSVYAEKIVYLVLFYGFEVLRLTNIWADVKTRNEVAIALYKKAGFIDEHFEKSIHGDAAILGCTSYQWYTNGRNQFESLIETELPSWE